MCGRCAQPRCACNRCSNGVGKYGCWGDCQYKRGSNGGLMCAVKSTCNGQGGGGNMQSHCHCHIAYTNLFFSIIIHHLFLYYYPYILTTLYIYT